MGLKETSHDLQRSLEGWHNDLRQINNALDRAREELRSVEDESTAEKFSKYFETFNALLEDLSKEVDRESGEVKTLVSEAVKSSAKPSQKPIV